MSASTFGSIAPGEGMISVEEAQARVLAEVSVLGVEHVMLLDALGRALRQDVVAKRDTPEADNSAMDGYAVRAGDIAAATSSNPVELRVVEDLPAGVIPSRTVDAGTAIRIMTGALVPSGADAIAQVEITDGASPTVRIYRALERGANIRRRGEDMRAGDVVLPDGILLGPGELGVAASTQAGVVAVGRRPRVAIIATGNEIVELGEPLAPGKIANSNSYALAALAHECGAEPVMGGIVPDSKAETIRAIESALACDFVVSTGGVSVGAYDFVKDALEALGASTRFWQVAMKPGKPVVFSRLRDRICFGLPGNPVSCLVAFHLFVAPAIRKASGLRGGILPPVVTARAAASLKSAGNRRAYLRVRVRAEGGDLIASPMRAQGSGVSTSMVGANGLAMVEAGAGDVEAGGRVPVALIGRIESA